jgi:hypothetical protein
LASGSLASVSRSHIVSVALDAAPYADVVLLSADAPNYADIMQAWGSILALPLALGAMVFTGLLLRHELRTRREDFYHSDSAQARLAVLEGIAYDDGADRTRTRVKYVVHNRSERVLLNVHVRHIKPDGSAYQSAARMITIEAGEKRWLSIIDDPQVATSIGETKMIHGMDLPFILVFDDAEGRRWFRRDGVRRPERMIREPVPRPSTVVGMLWEVWEVQRRLNRVTYWLDTPRREVKRRLRNRIWQKRSSVIDAAIKGAKSFMEWKATAELAQPLSGARQSTGQSPDSDQDR